MSRETAQRLHSYLHNDSIFRAGGNNRKRVFSIASVPLNTPYSRFPSSRHRPPADCRYSAVFWPPRSSPRCRATRIYCRTSIALAPTVDRRSTASPTRSDPCCSSARRRNKCPLLDRRVCESRATRLSRAWNWDNKIYFMTLRKEIYCYVYFS